MGLSASALAEMDLLSSMAGPGGAGLPASFTPCRRVCGPAAAGTVRSCGSSVRSGCPRAGRGRGAAHMLSAGLGGGRSGNKASGAPRPPPASGSALRLPGRLPGSVLSPQRARAARPARRCCRAGVGTAPRLPCALLWHRRSQPESGRTFWRPAQRRAHRRAWAAQQYGSAPRPRLAFAAEHISGGCAHIFWLSWQSRTKWPNTHCSILVPKAGQHPNK